jgi:perosamine synthetase
VAPHADVDDAPHRPVDRARHSLTVGYVAPAGTPISPPAALGALLAGAASPSAHAALTTALATQSGQPRAWLVSTGRAAMAIILKAMRSRDPARTDVIIPAYTCYSVPAAVKIAGLTPRLCDVDPATLSLDLRALERFDASRVLAVVSANLYGLPNDLAALETWTRARGIQLLDDAAQALGATFAGRPVGGFGDAGLYSFDKGKNITSIEGGAIVAGAALAPALDREYQVLSPTSAARTATTAVKLMAYSVMLRPLVYGLVNRLPLGLGQTPWEDDYPLARYSPVLARVALGLHRRLASLTATRREHAARLTEALGSLTGVTLPALLAGAAPAWARFPLFIEPDRRERAIRALQAAGIGATASYPQALCDVPQVRELVPASDLEQPGARAVASRIVTLPTHAYAGGVASRASAVLARL